MVVMDLLQSPFQSLQFRPSFALPQPSNSQALFAWRIASKNTILKTLQ